MATPLFSTGSTALVGTVHSRARHRTLLRLKRPTGALSMDYSLTANPKASWFFSFQLTLDTWVAIRDGCRRWSQTVHPASSPTAPGSLIAIAIKGISFG